VLYSVSAVAIGATIGALLRWWLGFALNHRWSVFPLGTWIANLLGGFLVGMAVAWFSQHPDVHPAWRLFVITGLLGGLTTFSTFSAEVVELMQSGRYYSAMLAALLHVLGSLAMTVLGISLIEALDAKG